MPAAAMRALPRSSNDRAGQAARASVRKAHDMVRDATLTDGVPTKGMPTGDTAVPPSRATEGLARDGMAMPGMWMDAPAAAPTVRSQLVAAAPAARRILRQTAVQNSVRRIAPGRLMGYKALPFCAARVGRWANRPANPIRTSRPRPGDING